ncbi:hypothetical protein CesoFtcFv8_016737 [Champsocephalus esox]|uniref:Secreted protein n=1 Tax=Champsocephalus esox TaxID=159716 RepID=A0AAN8GQS2_9TELE|nr:hypothetical protein CesoFtcFv8_016737 [Champsocephalus esox]
MSVVVLPSGHSSRLSLCLSVLCPQASCCTVCLQSASLRQQQMPPININSQWLTLAVPSGEELSQTSTSLCSLSTLTVPS